MLRGAPANDPARGRKAREASFAAPVGGWISNRNLARPNRPDMPQGAEVLENFFPTASGAILRRGSRYYAQLGDGTMPTTALFKYVVGNNRHLFAATTAAVYDITTISNAQNLELAVEEGVTISPDGVDPIGENSTLGLDVWTGALGGNWSTVQFSTTGNTYLIGVNGASEGFLFDGADFKGLDSDPAPKITFPAGSTLTTEDLSYVWAYKNRLWFVQKQSLSVWYLPVDQVGGELTEFPLGGVLGLGGALLLGQSWSLEGGNQGGLSEQCIFLSTEGEVAVYQGDNPADAAAWAKVGVYRIGRPLGYRAIVRAGGDLLIATSIGFIPLSKAIQADVAALAPSAVSSPIEVAWNDAVQQRGVGWNCVLWPEGQMVAVAPPTTTGTSPTFFAANALTGAWAPFTNWEVTCLEVFNGRLFFGSTNGLVIEAMVGGTDHGIAYTGVYMPLFSDEGAPTARKIARLARVTARSTAAVREKLSCAFDFNKALPAPPDVLPTSVGNEWESGIWNESVWSVSREAVLTQRRHSVSGSGYRLAPALQVTSGSSVPLDLEIIGLDLTYEMGDAFS